MDPHINDCGVHALEFGEIKNMHLNLNRFEKRPGSIGSRLDSVRSQQRSLNFIVLKKAPTTGYFRFGVANSRFENRLTIRMWNSKYICICLFDLDIHQETLVKISPSFCSNSKCV